MKKLSYIIIATLAAAVAVSCAKEFSAPVETGDPSMVRFTATTSAISRTYVKEGHTVWSASDVIKVFSGVGDGVEAKLKWGEDTPKATFEAQVPAAADYYALYPAALESSMPSAGTINVALPKVQTGLFGNAHIAVAKGVEKAFAFSNVNSFLKITLPEAGYKRIVVESASGKPLSGDLVVTFSGTTASAVPGTEVSSEVEIASETGFPAGDVFISVIAGITHDKGLVVKYYDASGLKGGFYLDKEVLTEASTIHSFGEFEVTGEYFATLEGAGNKMGLNAENAMDLAALKAFLIVPEDAEKQAAYAAALDGATIHLGAGLWDFSDSLAIAFPGAAAPVSVSFVGSASVDTTFITGAELHRILTIGENAKASFKNIAFVKGLGDKSYNSPVVVEQKASASFENCVFADCANKKSDGTWATGGCVYADSSSVVSFDYCEFFGNKGSYAATLLIKGKASLKNCRMHDNDGTWQGSALYLDNEDAECELINCILEDNTVTKEDGTKPDGGAVVVTHGKLTMNGCSLLRNSIPGRRGGALRVINSDSYAKLINCTVKENFSDWGGAINVADRSTVEIEGGEYAENYAKAGGCILITSDANLIVKDALIKENYLLSSGRFGGAIRHESNGTLTLLRTTLEGNYNLYSGEEEAFGAGVSVSDGQKDAEVTIDGCSFIGNHSGSGGGCALSYQSGGGSGLGWLKMSNTLFKDNYNEYSGSNNSNYGRHTGAVRLGHDATNSYLDNCTFINNYTMTSETEAKSAWGGAIGYYADGNGYINNCHFENNRAIRGGAIAGFPTPGCLYLNGCTFTGNWCSQRWGTTIMTVEVTKFCMNNCSIADDTFTRSNGEHQGTWVRLDTAKEECVVSNCSFIGSAKRATSVEPLALEPLSATEALLYADDANNGKNYYLVNNVIVAGNGQYSFVMDQKSGSTSNTIGTNNIYGTKSGSSAYSGTGDTAGKAISDLAGLAWDPTKFVWSWNGTLASGSYTKITAAGFAAALNTASPAFKNWLEEKGVLNKDQLGNDRGTGEWWPGAYQK